MPIIDDDDSDDDAPEVEEEEERGEVGGKVGGAEGKAALLQNLFGDDDSDDDDPADDAGVGGRVAKEEPASDASDADDESDGEIATAVTKKPKKAKKVAVRKDAKDAKAPAGKKKKDVKGATEKAGVKKAGGRKARGEKEAAKEPSAKEKRMWDKMVGGDEDDDEDGGASGDNPTRTAADDAFIDDEGVVPEDRRWGGGDGDEEGLGEDGDRSPIASEAEEDDEDDIDKLFGHGGKGNGPRKKHSEAVITSDVLNFLARMEVATEQDRESVAANKPAVFKLRMLKEMTDKLKHVDLHESFLRHGLLKVLASWLNLLPDHNLPNTDVRTAVIDAVRILPIETDLNDRKEELKRSGLGRLIMFLSTLPEETANNRKKCKALVEKWSRPVYELSSQYRDLRGRVEDDPDDDRPKKKSRGAGDGGEGSGGRGATEDHDVVRRAQEGPRYGEQGYRYHAAVPQKEAMDYAIRPKLKIDPSEIKARTQSADQQRVRKLVGKVAKKHRMGEGKAYLPSVEGRGMVTYH